MGILNRVFLFLFSLLALAIGLVGCAVFLGITSLAFIDTQLGFFGWVLLGFVWLLLSFRFLLLSVTPFSKKKDLSEEKLISNDSSGKMILTPEVVHGITGHALDTIPGIHDVHIEPFFQKGKMEIRVHLKADGDKNLPELIKTVQTRISERIETQTGIKPTGVVVEVDQILPIEKTVNVSPAEEQKELEKE